jgi:hypothetical protein
MKRNKILGGIILVAITTLAIVNVGISSSKTSTDLKLVDVEALSTEWNNPLDWFKYGLRADERIATTSCEQTTTKTTIKTTSSPSSSISVNLTFSYRGLPIGVSSDVSSGNSIEEVNKTINTTIRNGTKKTCETGGTVNCDACECC